MSTGERYSRFLHAVCTYYGQWLPGDERGWRSRRHRLHSSGDYRNPPPPGEYEKLHIHAHKVMAGGPVALGTDELPRVGLALITKLLKMGCSVRCLSAGSTHVHLLYDSFAEDAAIELGRAKQYASLKLTTRPGRLWGKHSKIIVVRDVQHARSVWRYILDHAAKEQAWTWRYDRDDPP